MSKSNENNPHMMLIPLGTRTGATQSVPGGYVRKKMIIRQASLLSGTTAATATNTTKVFLKNGTSTIASIDSTTGAITPFVSKQATETNVSVAAGSDLHVKIEGAGTAGVTDGVLALECYRV